MSDVGMSISVDLFWIAMVIMFVMFFGEPDLMDAIIANLCHGVECPGAPK